MSLSVSGNVKYSRGNISFNTQFNKFFSTNFLYLKFETTEKSLLYNILKKYLHEKTLFIGTNRINDIVSGFVTTRGIVVNCTEKKIISNISNILAYINKTKLQTKELEKLTSKTANYNKLRKDCASFSVYISGKCQHIQKAISTPGDKKISHFVETLDKVDIKELEEQPVKAPYEEGIISFSGSSREKLDLTVALEDVPFVIEGDKIKLIDPHSLHVIIEKSEYEYLQGKLKSFLICCGTPGTPSANDTGGKAHKAKCAYILDCLNSVAFIMGDVHGFKHEFKDIKEITDGVLADSKAKIKAVYKAAKSSLQ